MKQEQFDAIKEELGITPTVLDDNSLKPNMFHSLEVEDIFEPAAVPSGAEDGSNTHEGYNALRLTLRCRLEVQLKQLHKGNKRAPPRYLVNAANWKLMDLDQENPDIILIELYCSRLDKDVALGELHGILSRAKLEACLQDGPNVQDSPAFVKLTEQLGRITLALGDEALRKAFGDPRAKAALGRFPERDAETLRSTALRTIVAVRTELLLHASSADCSSRVIANIDVADRLFGLLRTREKNDHDGSFSDQSKDRFFHAV